MALKFTLPLLGLLGPQCKLDDGVVNLGGALHYASMANPNEANLQAEFYHFSRILGFHCVLEFSTPCGRHDIAILTPDCLELAAVIECKRERAANPNSWQMIRYKQLGVELFSLHCLNDAEQLARTIAQRLLEGSLKSIPLTAIHALKPSVKRFSRKRARTFNVMNCDEDLNLK